MRNYLTPKDIAKLEHVDPETVRRWARSEMFEGVRKVGRGYRIPIESYQQWREKTKVLLTTRTDDRSNERPSERTDNPH